MTCYEFKSSNNKYLDDARMTGIYENFFQDIFRKKLEFGGIKYDEYIPGLIRRDRNVNIRFDIVLLNEKRSIALIVVKYGISSNFIKELAEKHIVIFKKYFPEFSDCDIYLGIAGFSIDDEIFEQANKYGIGIVVPASEDEVEIKADNLKVY